MDLFPNNTLQNYTTQLSVASEFTGRWEVGLYEIMYPRMWYNVTEEDVKCHVMFSDKTTKECFLPTGRYTSIEQLIRQLNETLNSIIPNGEHVFDLSYNTLTRKVSYKLGRNNGSRSFIEYPAIVGTTFSKGISSILGFKDIRSRSEVKENEFAQNLGVFTGASAADLDKGIHSLYIYTDIIEPCAVGDTRAPLLRVVPLDSSNGVFQCTRSFSQVQYHPLKYTRLSTVEVDIKDSIGRPVPFERGTLMLTLHLRKAQ